MDEADAVTAPKQPDPCIQDLNYEVDTSAVNTREPSAISVSRAERLRQLVQQSRQRILCKPQSAALQNQKAAIRVPEYSTSISDTLKIQEV